MTEQYIDGNIIQRDIGDSMKKAYLDYSMSATA